MGFTQSVTANSGAATVTSLSATWSTTPVPGKFLGLLVSSDATVATPSGWSVGSSDVHRNGGYFFWKYAGGAEASTVTVTPGSAATTAMTIFEMDDAVASSPIDQVATPYSRTSDTTAAFTNTLTTGVANTRVLALIASSILSGGSAQFQDYTSGFSEIAETVSAHASSNNVGVTLVAKDVAASGTAQAFTASPYEGNGVVPTGAAGAMMYVSVKVVAATPLSIAAGSDQAIYTGQTATLTGTPAGGSGSRSYNWTKINGPSATLSTPNAASTTFTPSGAGTYTLRVIVTDSTGSAQDDVVVVVTTAPTLVAPVSVASSTGWTPTGGTVLAVVSDSSDATLITSSDNPTNVLVDVTLGPVSVPGAGQNFTVRVRCRKVGASSGTLTGKLYEGATLRSTVAVTPPNTLGDVDIVFPLADLASIAPSAWTGIRVTLSGTAAA